MLRSNCCRLLLSLVVLAMGFKVQATDEVYDVVVYGGTSGGIAAALQVKRMGGSVVVIEPTKRIGGLTTGGLGQTDIGNKAAIGGVSIEFYQRIRKHYSDEASWKWQPRESYRSGGQSVTAQAEAAMWTFEPSAALKVLESMARDAGVPIVYGERLDRSPTKTAAHVQPFNRDPLGSASAAVDSAPHERAPQSVAVKQVSNAAFITTTGVTKDRARITTIKMESGKVVKGRVFIDATYEGDLMAAAGVSYTVGREANATYKETLSGVQVANSKHHQLVPSVDPYVKPGDPSSGLLPGIDPKGPGEEGAADARVQAYCFRMCVTDHPENRIPFAKPEGYDERLYELGLRNFEAGEKRIPWSNSSMPNRKTDINNNFGFSTDFIGENYSYPEASYAERAAIIARHLKYQQGLLWTWANHPRVPEHVRKEIGRWGMCKDEFTSGNGWQEQLYIREARRMVGAYVMTQHNCQGRVTAERPIGLAAYTMDSHNVQRYVDKNGHARNEGDVQVGGFAPFPIDYGSITPQQSECDNLFVPVCLSASHMAFGSIRMEPVFMVLGQSAATAAMLSIEAKSPIQTVDYAKLRERLLADKQVLIWTGPKPAAATGIEVKSLPGLVIDDEAAERTGFETSAATVGPFVGSGYRHDSDMNKGECSARFRFKLAAAGKYEVRVAYPPNPNRASTVPVTIKHASGSTTVKLDQKKKPTQGAFEPIGTFDFAAGEAVIEITNKDTTGHVILDAVQLLPVARN